MHSAKLFTVLLSLFSCVVLTNGEDYSNPIWNPNGSDPFIVYTGGYYYLLTTTWTDVEMSRATTLEGLKASTKKVIYSTTTASRCCNVWSPEVHYLNDIWYIYYTAGVSANLDSQTIHVLQGALRLLDSSLMVNADFSLQEEPPPGTTSPMSPN
jgi:GH43 family beta-xylosidase